jgi:hypothetical protein
MLGDMENLRSQKGFIKFDIRRQGPLIMGLLAIFYGYFGIICNLVMVDEYGYPIQYIDWEQEYLLIYTFETYIRTYFLPVILLFFICFIITYKEEIPHYGLKHALWFVPYIIAISFIWYWVISGFSSEPFILLFAHWKGYVNILLLLAINFSGSISGMKLKKYIIKKRRLG